jgi:hypothetical protein
MSKSSIYGAMAVFGLAVVLTGCGSSSSDTPKGRVRVFNALTNVPNNANVDVNVNNGQGTSNNIAFGAGDLSASTVNAGGNIPVTVNSTGTTTALATSNGLNIAQGADNLLLVAGTVGAAGATAPQILSLGQINVGSTPVSNQARVYFINAAPGSTGANFDLTATNPGANPGTSTASVTNVAYGVMAAPQLVTVNDANSTLALNITSNGQTVTSNPTPTTVAGGNTYAVVLTGVPGGNPAPTAKIFRLNP